MISIYAEHPKSDITAILYRVGSMEAQVVYLETPTQIDAVIKALNLIPGIHNLRPEDPFRIVDVYARPGYTGWYWRKEICECCVDPV